MVKLKPVQSGKRPRVLPFILMAFVILSCQNGNGGPDGSNPGATAKSTPPAKKEEKAPTFTASVRATPMPNRYLVVLEWGGIASDPDVWALDKREEKALIAPFTTVAGSVRRFTDTDVVAGRTYTYSLKVESREDAEPIESATVTIPRDLEIRGKRVLRSIKDINRLFLAKQSHLITLGKEFHLEVNEIVSTNGTIESFADKTTATIAGMDGRAAGLMTIRAKRGSGVLNIIARGENGAVGKPGATGAAGMAGKTGGCYTCTRSAFVPAGYCIGNTFLPGGDGGPAGDGSTGGQGGRGGSSAKLLVVIENPKGLSIVPGKVPGHGGAGGPGGAPGPGGLAGAAYPPNTPEGCRIGRAGKKGPDGRRGPDGRNGADGIAQPVCLILGSTVLGDCEAFPTQEIVTGK